jgi:hypothetical protein
MYENLRRKCHPEQLDMPSVQGLQVLNEGTVQTTQVLRLWTQSEPGLIVGQTDLLVKWGIDIVKEKTGNRSENEEVWKNCF